MIYVFQGECGSFSSPWSGVFSWDDLPHPWRNISSCLLLYRNGQWINVSLHSQGCVCVRERESEHLGHLWNPNILFIANESLLKNWNLLSFTSSDILLWYILWHTSLFSVLFVFRYCLLSWERWSTNYCLTWCTLLYGSSLDSPS